MNKIKKITSLVMMAVMLMQLTACSQGSGSGSNKETTMETEEGTKYSGPEQLVLATLESSYNLEEMVEIYTQNNSKYEITIKEYCYDEDRNLLSYDDALSRLKQDIMEGDSIDIVCLDDINPQDIFGNEMFEDLYTYIQNDTGMSERRLNENILKLYEDSGSLMAIPSKFCISCMVSEKSLLGDENLTADRFLEIMQSNVGKQMYDYCSRAEELDKLVAANINYLIDRQKKTCNFNDGSFETILEIASGFEEKKNYIGGTEEIKMIMEGEMLFSRFSFSNAEEYGYYIALFGNDFNITGYPSLDENALEASISGLFAINKNSNHKESCWKFIKSMFNSQFSADSNDSGFSVDMDEMEKQLDKICKVDSNGNEIRSGYYKYLHVDDIVLEYPYISESQKNDLREIALSVKSLLCSEETICQIVNEEAEAFFDGSKSAAEVCEIIQSRVEEYLKEKY